MFPAGMPGFALLAFRLSIVATLMMGGVAQWAFATSIWLILGITLLAILLSLGFLTPYSASVGALIQFGMLMAGRGRNESHVAIAIVNCGVLAVLGPGAYSIDARCFGWRLLTIPPRK
jgi:hypothetical protein